MAESSRINTIARIERLPGTAPVLAALIARLEQPEPPAGVRPLHHPFSPAELVEALVL